jgi:hypothetical protein
VLKKRLEDVEKHLKTVFDGLPEDQKVDPVTNKEGATFEQWCGLRQSTTGWRSMSGFHGSGSAVDVNYNTNPYIATRTDVPKTGGGTKTVLGGELAGAGLQTQRRQAAEVYDRAVEFAGGTGDKANVSERKDRTKPTRESTADVYARFKATSDALAEYLQLAFLDGDVKIKRRPVKNADTASEADLLKEIPLTERRSQADGEALIKKCLDDWLFKSLHPGWTKTPTQQYFQILRDYELVRIPMVFGQPDASPAETRNPARGFVDLRQELVEAMVDVGKLRWGAADFGPAESGDVQHFDLGGDAGFTPE